MGRFDDAIALYKKAHDFTGRPGFGLAITYARMNRRKEALQTLEAAIVGWGYRAGDAIAHVHVVLGAHDDAIRELERACEQRSSSLHGVGIAPEFAPLRSDKRFLSILKKIGLEPEKVFAAAAPSLLHDYVPAVAVRAHTVFVEVLLRHVHSKQQYRNQTEIQNRHYPALRRCNFKVALFFF